MRKESNPLKWKPTIQKKKNLLNLKQMCKLADSIRSKNLKLILYPKVKTKEQRAYSMKLRQRISHNLSINQKIKIVESTWKPIQWDAPSGKY